MDRFLERYHSKIVASGKVKAEEWPYKEFKAEVIDYIAAKWSCLWLLLPLLPDKDMAEMVFLCYEQFVEDYPEVMDHDIPMIFLCKMTAHKINPAEY